MNNPVGRLRAQADFASEMAKSPYNNSAKEKHVRQIFEQLAVDLHAIAADLENKEMPAKPGEWGPEGWERATGVPSPMEELEARITALELAAKESI
jgi:hypothetical protein